MEEREVLKSNIMGFSRLRRLSKRFLKGHENVIDIVLYGSAARGKERPRDLDFLLFLKDGSGDALFELPHQFKKLLRKEGFQGADVKAATLEELFSPNLKSRRGILLEGVSLVKGKKLGEMLGFTPHLLVTYDLSGMEKSKKVRFSYSLNGRRDKKGMLEEKEGRMLSPGSIMIPFEFSYEFREYLASWDVKFEAIAVLAAPA